jgi:hypothetical protein
MIKIHGQADKTAEFAAAEQLARIAGDAIPMLHTSPRVVLHLFPSAQCFGQKAQDVDLLVFFADYRQSGDLCVSASGKRLHSFCAAVEVKGHSPEHVIFEGSKCLVRYHGELHDVTLQSEKQKHSVRKYIERNIKSASAPWIVNLIWLTRVRARELPEVESNVLGSDSTWNDLVERVALLAGRGDAPEVAAFSSQSWMNTIVDVFSRRLEQSKIDRKRMEAITKGVLDKTQQQYASKLGQQLLIFRGPGGTGKTVRLIRIAYQAYLEEGYRVLLLTYNKALVADLRRQLTLLRIQDAIGEGSIAVKTIHSFMKQWLIALGLFAESRQDFMANYEALKLQGLELLKGGAIGSADLTAAKASASRDLAWDLVLIDESQDWPSSERDLLYTLYGYQKIIVADGIDQFVRGVDRVNWREGLNSSLFQIVSLRKSLRLKSALCEIVGHFASLIEFSNWNLEPQQDSHGGKVIVVTGDPLNREFHSRIAATARSIRRESTDRSAAMRTADLGEAR